MKIIIDVEPADMNGSGKPVGGTSPVTTATFKRHWMIIIEPIPTHKRKPNLSGAILATLKTVKTKTTKSKIKKLTPTNPTSSAIIERMKSDSANGKNKYFCLDLKTPTPNIPPSAIPRSDWTSWNPSPLLEANGSMNATSRFSLYGSIKTSKTTRAIAGMDKSKKCFKLAPPTKSITTIKRAMQIVMDIFGSKIMSTQKIAPTTKTGSSPLNDFIFSLDFESTLAAKIINEIFASSDGWKVINPRLIHLVAP